MVHFGNEWDNLLSSEFEQEYYKQLRRFLKQEYATQTIYPDMYHIFNALQLTSYSDVKAVILGQDPYHGPGQAHGLCFSVQRGVMPPPSLQNIFKEQQSDLGLPIPQSGDLTAWAKQGVLLLNTVLTVRQGMPNSHKNRGWEIFTDRIISLLDDRDTPMVFLLWGANAGAKTALLHNPRHLVLKTVHPSPLSAHRGWFGCRHFSKANAFLQQNGIAPIDWRL